jgi:hypothetical protein
MGVSHWSITRYSHPQTRHGDIFYRPEIDEPALVRKLDRLIPGLDALFCGNAEGIPAVCLDFLECELSHGRQL